MSVYNVYKPAGKSPLEALTKFREKYRIKSTLTYAGRLDPLAEGVLLLLGGIHKKQKDKYLALSKTYIAKILFGFGTDTHDVLGIVKSDRDIKISKKTLELELKKFSGLQNLSVPVYSSVPVRGKPLFEWARQGKLKEVEIPKRDMHIFEIKLLKLSSLNAQDLNKQITKKIKLVSGDFRQKEILARWNKLLIRKNRRLLTAVVMLRCGSGTYVRAIAENLGEKLGTRACLLNLVRTKVGNFKQINSQKV